MTNTPYVAVVGPAAPDDPMVLERAREAGRLLAERGYVVVTGGLAGVMAAAAAGVAEAGGTAVALLPGTDRTAASAGHSVVIATGMGEMRNALLVRSVDALIAVGGSWGTLSEMALAARTGVPVLAVGSWELPEPGVLACADVATAVDRVAALITIGS
ncbi:TIGR00725 family protein [soil metagenome]